MSEKTSVLLSDVAVKGDIVEKETLILDSKVEGDITVGKLETHSGANINGNINASSANLGGTSKGNINSDTVKIKSTADVDGVLTDSGMYYTEIGDELKKFNKNFPLPSIIFRMLFPNYRITSNRV